MEITIRPIRLGDEEDINRLRRMPGVFENILGLPTENIERNRQSILHMDRNTHHLVAVNEDHQVIGSICLTVFSNPRKQHVGSLGIMVDKNYQGEHIGSQLMEAILNLADQWLMLVRIELSVFVDNEKAIGLYKKYGFEIEGKLRKAAVRNGKYVDEYIMARVTDKH